MSTIIDDLAVEIARVRHGDNCTASDLAQRLAPWIFKSVIFQPQSSKIYSLECSRDEYLKKLEFLREMVQAAWNDGACGEEELEDAKQFIRLLTDMKG